MNGDLSKLFVPYKLAILSKEKGFDESCIAWFNDDRNIIFYPLLKGDSLGVRQQDLHYTHLLAPLYQQIVDWFREKHKICITVQQFDKWFADIEDIPFTKALIDGRENYGFNNYYEALNKAITEAFKLI